MKYSGIGGQAVMEGVMMQNKDTYAVAVRKPDHEIDVKVSKRKNSKALDAVRKIPILRGVVSFVDSLYLGMRTLMYSASFFEDEDDEGTLASKKKEKERAEFIRSEDIEEIKTEMIEAAISEARKEVIRLLGVVISGMNVPQSTVRAVAEVPEEELSDDVMDDEDVAGLAMGWMSKGD